MNTLTARSALEHALLSSHLATGARILVAVSGGPDSVALLRSLADLAPGRSWEVCVGHVHHGLRGEEADCDETFVRGLAHALGLHCEIRRIDTPAYARERRLSPEAAARELRYGALREILRSWPGEVIATAHTQDDQAETLMLNLLRGSGLDGLGAMLVRHGTLLRPFLAVSRQTIRDALMEWNQPYRVDSSNTDERFRRNALRATVMPPLETIQPRAPQVLARAASLLAADAAFIEDEVTRLLPLLEVRIAPREISASLPVWVALHPALQRHVLRRLVRTLLEHRRDFNAGHIEIMVEALRAAADSKVEMVDRFPHGVALMSDNRRFHLQLGGQQEHPDAYHAILPVPGSTQIPPGLLSAHYLDGISRQDVNRRLAVCGPHHAFCDAAIISKQLLVRSWLPGDRMAPLGMTGHRKLQDLFVDRKVPEAERHRIPIIEDGVEIVWVPGIATGRAARVTQRTTRVAHLRLQPL
ncbi:MAG: tRNA lysidine(34) synthetase TilS [Chloroflexota bacterium]|nr:tRNA lysidine(34) synthetase TilS [Chloroflexota bacterium]